MARKEKAKKKKRGKKRRKGGGGEGGGGGGGGSDRVQQYEKERTHERDRERGPVYSMWEERAASLALAGFKQKVKDYRKRCGQSWYACRCYWP